MTRPAKSISILFIGNSYTNRNDLPEMLERLALAGWPPVKVVTERFIANGMSLKTHWDRGIAAGVIREQRWDYVVLQDQSTMLLKKPTRLKEYAAKFDVVCREAGSRTALYMTWARKDASDRQPEITAAYLEAAAPINAIVVPVGTAWQLLSRRTPETDSARSGQKLFIRRRNLFGSVRVLRCTLRSNTFWFAVRGSNVSRGGGHPAYSRGIAKCRHSIKTLITTR